MLRVDPRTNKGDLRSDVSAGSETRAEHEVSAGSETRAEHGGRRPAPSTALR